MNDLIIDGPSLFARCWFAVREDPDAAKTAFVRSVLVLLDQEEGKFGLPIHRTLFGWDGRAKTDKHRKAKPPEYLDTRYALQEALLTLFGTVHGFHADYEADDVVATAAFESRAKNVFVVSGDKDLMQLQGGNVAYYDLNSKTVLASRHICRKFCVKQPVQVAIALAIIGDSGDGLKGIPKWGPKKVEKLFEAVREDMDFNTALEAIQAQIPPHLMPCFLETLDATLLHNDVPGLPEPAPLAFCQHGDLKKIGIYEVGESFERVAIQYEDLDELMDEMLKDSKSESRRLNHG